MQAETTVYSVVWWVLFEYSSFDHFPNKNKLCYFARFHCWFACGLAITTSALNAGDRASSPRRRTTFSHSTLCIAFTRSLT